MRRFGKLGYLLVIAGLAFADQSSAPGQTNKPQPPASNSNGNGANGGSGGSQAGAQNNPGKGPDPDHKSAQATQAPPVPSPGVPTAPLPSPPAPPVTPPPTQPPPVPGSDEKKGLTNAPNPGGPPFVPPVLVPGQPPQTPGGNGKNSDPEPGPTPPPVPVPKPAPAEPPSQPTAPPAPSAGKISSDLQNIINATPPSPTPQPSAPTVPVIVQFSNPATSSDQQSIQNLGGVSTGDLPLIQATAIAVSPDRISDLANLPNVAFVSLDRPVAATLDYVTATTGASIEWKYGFDGAGIGVAVIDSGIYPHGDLKGADFTSRIVYRQSFTASTASDAYGHGTHVAGIVGANGWASTSIPGIRPYRGVAPRANLIDLQVLDGNGQGNDSTVIAAIHRAIELKDKYNIRVMAKAEPKIDQSFHFAMGGSS